MASEPTTTPLQQAEAELARLKSFLATAPSELHDWAAQQVEAAEQALDEARRHEAEAARRADDAREAKLLGLDADDLDAPAPRLRANRTAAGQPKGGRAWYVFPMLMIVTALAILAIFIYGDKSQQMPQGHPATNGAQTSATPTVDVQMLAALEARVEKNPRDVESWRALGQMYDKLAAYDKAVTAQQAVLAVDPNDVNAHLALGVAQYKLKKFAEAERAWHKALEIDPKSAQAYYNLGFLYLGNNELAKAKDAWNKVVTLAPGSTLAENAQAHLSGLNKAASATPSAPATRASSSPTTSASPS